jgi:hypothetical protein
MPKITPLIVCADDFALNASVSAAIVQLAGLGRLSATSAMVLSPRWRDDAQALRELRGRIDVGLHLDWTSSFAHAAGHGLSLRSAMLHGLGGFDEQRAQRVIEHQLDAFEAQWQAPPDFVDGHQHVQQLGGIRQALVAALRRRYGSHACKPYLRLSRVAPGLRSFKARVIAALGANDLEKIAASAGFTGATALFGIYNFDPTPERYAQHMQRWLARLQGASILMCHPATQAEPDDAIGPARVQEFAYLGSAAFAQALRVAGVHLARGCEALPAAGAALHCAQA